MRTPSRTGRPWRRLLCALTVLSVACSGNAGPGTPAPGVAETAAHPGGGQPDDASAPAGSEIPPDYVPPPGMCRVWVPGDPPGEPADRRPAGRCSQLRTEIPEGGWLIYRPTDDSGQVRVWQYGSDGQVLAQRIYDIATGRLIRHVAPASGG